MQILFEEDSGTKYDMLQKTDVPRRHISTTQLKKVCKSSDHEQLCGRLGAIVLTSSIPQRILLSSAYIITSAELGNVVYQVARQQVFFSSQLLSSMKITNPFS